MERNTIAGITATVMSSFMEFVEPLKWFLLFALFLIIADLRFGIAKSRKRGEEIRFSRAGKRSINKIIDYICWILVAGAGEQAFGVPLNIPIFPALALLVVYGLEINSVYCNYCETKGKKIKINVFKIFGKKADFIEMDDKKD